MGMLVFGDEQFVQQFIGDKTITSINGTASDHLTAMQTLRVSESRDVVIGFPGSDGIELCFNMAELYRDKKFYLAPTVRATADLWANAAARGVTLITRREAPRLVSQAIQGRAARQPVSEEAIALGEKKHIGSLQATRVLRRKRVCCFSLLGGTGKSTLASSIACTAALWAARQQIDYKVVVVGGTANRAQTIFESLRVSDTVSQGIDAFQNLEGVPGWDNVVKQLVQPDPVSLPGLYFLPPPVLSTNIISGDLMMHILTILDNYFDLVVVDADPSLDRDATLVAVQTSSLVLLLVRGNAADIRSTRSHFMPYIPKLQINLKSLRLVVTRVHPGEEKRFSPENVAKTLGSSIVPFPLVVPEDMNVYLNANDPGQPPVVVANRDCPYARALCSLTSSILGVEVGAGVLKQRLGLFPHFRKKVMFHGA
jgi:MinD-like ATPase involved in chromosome partitioning or flagellar assembly